MNFPINIRRVAGIIGVIILAFVVLEFNRRLEELNLLNKQREQTQIQSTQVMQTQVALQTQVAYAGSDNAVEEWARVEGHYVQEGDLPVVPLGQPGAAPLEQSTPTPQATPLTNWQVWWNLFFGDQ
jgi:hypothetical protein